jgi:hypothetical protein
MFHFLLRGSRPAPDDQTPACAAFSPPTNAGDDVAPTAATGNAIRLFVCKGRKCQHTSEASRLIAALREEIARSGISAGAPDVHASGCLDCCDEGPVVIACWGDAARSSRPPRVGTEAWTRASQDVFFRASPENARHIVDVIVNRIH